MNSRFSWVQATALCILPVQLSYAADVSDTSLARAQRLLANPDTILVDGYNSLPLAMRFSAKAPGDIVDYDLRRPSHGQTDLARLHRGYVVAQIWSASIPSIGGIGLARMQLEQIDLTKRMIAHYPEAL